MVVCCLLVTFLLGVNLFNKVSVQAKNVSEILDEKDGNVLQVLTTSFENINVLKNESYYKRECDCGPGSRGCYYNVYGEKLCECKADYAQNNDKCEQCDCGFWSIGCHFNVYGGKICNCLTDYAQNNDKCERCYCGLHATLCTFQNNKKMCICSENYLLDDYNEKCVECNCGYDAISCHLNGLSKVCTCREGYNVVDGKCTRCDCGPNSISCELTTDKYTRCKCESGYIAERRTWKVDEYCKLPGVSVWKIATYIESVIFALIIIVCTIIICLKRYRKEV